MILGYVPKRLLTDGISLHLASSAHVTTRHTVRTS